MARSLNIGEAGEQDGRGHVKMPVWASPSQMHLLWPKEFPSHVATKPFGSRREET